MDIYKFLSYSKSVQGQSILTHLQKESVDTKAIRCFLYFFRSPQRLVLPHNPASSEGNRDFNPSCCHGDNLWRVPQGLTDFPLSYVSFLSDGRRGGNDFRGKEVCDSHTTKTNVCSNPLRVSIPQVFSLDVFSHRLHCGWLLTPSVLCDDGAFCCFWGCGFSCCWCLWW